MSSHGREQSLINDIKPLLSHENGEFVVAYPHNGNKGWEPEQVSLLYSDGIDLSPYTVADCHQKDLKMISIFEYIVRLQNRPPYSE